MAKQKMRVNQRRRNEKLIELGALNDCFWPASYTVKIIVGRLCQYLRYI